MYTLFGMTASAAALALAVAEPAPLTTTRDSYPVLSPDGKSRLSFEGFAAADQGQQLAERAARRLLDDGAARLIAANRK